MLSRRSKNHPSGGHYCARFHNLKGRLHLDDWISARIKLSEINDGFANMKAGKVLRSVIMFDA